MSGQPEYPVVTELHMALARHMFDRQAASYGADPEEANLAWLDPGVRRFWLDEAWAVLTWLAGRS